MAQAAPPKATYSTSISSRFSVLSVKWRHLGVYFFVTPDPYLSDRWVFHSFARGTSALKGSGGEALAEVCRLADELGITLFLFVHKAAAHKLVPYYEHNGGFISSYETYNRVYMERVPSCVTSSSSQVQS